MDTQRLVTRVKLQSNLRPKVKRSDWLTPCVVGYHLSCGCVGCSVTIPKIPLYVVRLGFLGCHDAVSGPVWVAR